MKIADSRVHVSSQWSAVKQLSTKENLEYWNQNQDQDQNQNTNDNILLDISDQGKALQLNNISAPSSPKGLVAYELTDKDREKIDLLEHFIYVLTGKRIKLRTFDPEIQNNDSAGQNGAASVGWGLKYDREEFHYEAESMSFNSSGSIVTEDGRTINFNLNFNVSREFMSYHRISIRAGDALIDPLVLNFRNTSAMLGDRDYSFDIDSDGKNDLIAFTRPGSGFLALDKNNNNVIDDGSELFGPQTGNGFDELAGYDEDNNGWIDENDPIFDKLRIWTTDESGNKVLLALGQVGVGAIYLGNVQTEFGIKSQSNDALGQIRSSGIFLKENGQVGTIQHVDLVV